MNILWSNNSKILFDNICIELLLPLINYKEISINKIFISFYKVEKINIR